MAGKEDESGISIAVNTIPAKLHAQVADLLREARRHHKRGGKDLGTVLTVMNMKGGVGKTTVAMHLAGIVSQYKIAEGGPRKVLLIDYDPQFNLSQSFLPTKDYYAAEKARKTTLSILVDDDASLNPYAIQVSGNHKPPKVANVSIRIYQSKRSGSHLDLVPSTLDLMYVALGQATGQTDSMKERFEKFIEEARSLYDLVVMDCHPAGSLFTQTALANSDHVVIPVVPQRYSVRGIGLMMEFMKSKKIGQNGPIPHILFNAVPRVGVSNQEADIRADKRFTQYCMKNTLKKFKAFAEPEGGKGFVWNSSKPWSGVAFNNLDSVAEELLTKMGI